MTRHLWSNSVKLFFFFLLSKVQLQFCYELKMGPAGYLNYRVANLYQICPLNGKSSNNKEPMRIRLSNRYSNALIIFPELPYSDYVSNNMNELNDWNCTFIIEASFGESLFASVQSMTFDTKDNCSSYVEFTPKTGHPGEKKCGYFKKNAKSGFWDNFTPRIDIQKMCDDSSSCSSIDLGAYSTGGKIKTEIFVPKWEPWSDVLNGLVIVYTPYKQCYLSDCSSGYLQSYDICMRREYVCDGIENCYQLCKDERKNCSTEKTSRNYYLIVPPFIIGIIVICLYRKRTIFRCYIWGTALRNDRQPDGIADCSEHSGVSIRNCSRDRICPSRPDSLPSYESLFPTRTNPFNSNRLVIVH